jgi:hypothetical protein
MNKDLIDVEQEGMRLRDFLFHPFHMGFAFSCDVSQKMGDMVGTNN